MNYESLFVDMKNLKKNSKKKKNRKDMKYIIW